MKKTTKIIIAVVSVIAFIVLLLFTFFLVDKIRMNKGELPIFNIKVKTYNDGGSSQSIGLFYKKFDFHITDEYEQNHVEGSVITGYGATYSNALSELLSIQPDNEKTSEILLTQTTPFDDGGSILYAFTDCFVYDFHKIDGSEYLTGTIAVPQGTNYEPALELYKSIIEKRNFVDNNDVGYLGNVSAYLDGGTTVYFFDDYKLFVFKKIDENGGFFTGQIIVPKEMTYSEAFEILSAVKDERPSY